MADITYLPTQKGVAYLSLVADAFSRKIVGYYVHESLDTESVAHALRREMAAFEFRGKGAALFGRLPRSGEHSRLNGCPVPLDH